MKQLLALVIAGFCLTSFAAEPVQPIKQDGMILAKKKDHSKDKKVTPTKSPKKAKAKATKK